MFVLNRLEIYRTLEHWSSYCKIKEDFSNVYASRQTNNTPYNIYDSAISSLLHHFYGDIQNVEDERKSAEVMNRWLFITTKFKLIKSSSQWLCTHPRVFLNNSTPNGQYNAWTARITDLNFNEVIVHTNITNITWKLCPPRIRSSPIINFTIHHGSSY